MAGHSRGAISANASGLPSGLDTCEKIVSFSISYHGEVHFSVFRGTRASIPLHPALAAALLAWRQVNSPSDFVVASERGGQMTPLSIVVWFNRAFKHIGLNGCSRSESFWPTRG